MAVSRNSAQDLATDLLLALAERPEQLAGFLGTSGLEPAALRQIASRPEIAVFLLDYIVEQDDRLLEFASAIDRDPRDVMTARTLLSGPGSYGWEAD
ncbi:DUF3572 family protein [Paracoccus sp. 1_MG-2023]|uniref:DUF3572 family protein n=1 Tax=unclassified Paracoccus (in: a-proteobacteria) TaxID=2688777 RepID=UPI001C088101|nr:MULTISPECIES: DUF3572 family protein [unclassified Paracoccus (in: a-proteobacteria)]MBU2956763.1 DUF3572 domain-containing protein [Paracoccus sp. C2R09]MDO6669198.1 DUF3572 family protein [Paracoccus sp. 1_MG-2023]